jgi:arsenate reductase (thioredoxin)
MKNSIMFVCVGNSARSQIAEAWAKKLAPSSMKIQSAGTQPAKEVNSLTMEVMKEVGIDIAKNKPKLITPALMKGVTHFISMGCTAADSCPVPLSQIKTEDWDLEELKGKPISVFRKVRDQIKEKVQDLLKRLNP